MNYKIKGPVLNEERKTPIIKKVLMIDSNKGAIRPIKNNNIFDRKSTEYQLNQKKNNNLPFLSTRHDNVIKSHDCILKTPNKLIRNNNYIE